MKKGMKWGTLPESGFLGIRKHTQVKVSMFKGEERVSFSASGQWGSFDEVQSVLLIIEERDLGHLSRGEGG